MPDIRVVLSAVALWACTGGVLAAQNQQTPPRAPLVATYDGRLRAPPGVQVTKFASVDGARGVAVGPDGAVYVSQTQLGQVTRLVDATGDGVSGQQTVVLRGLNLPHGMAFHDGWMYVANTNAVVRFRLDANNLPSGAPQTIATYSSGSGHFTRSIVFGVDGALYVSIGSSCNLCEERTPDRASVMRFDPNGGGGRVFSSGLRNAVGIAREPGDGQDLGVAE